MACLGCAAANALSASRSSANVALVLVFGRSGCAGLGFCMDGFDTFSERIGGGVGAVAQAARAKHIAKQKER